jgi:hypothetical protein
LVVDLVRRSCSFNFSRELRAPAAIKLIVSEKKVSKNHKFLGRRRLPFGSLNYFWIANYFSQKQSFFCEQKLLVFGNSRTLPLLLRRFRSDRDLTAFSGAVKVANFARRAIRAPAQLL